MNTKLFLHILCLLLLYDFADNINFPLTVRLLENAICQQYYDKISPGGQLDELKCKIVEIQSRLALIRGIHSLCLTILAIPFGLFFGGLADRWGRRPVYAIALGGLLLQLGSLYIICTFWHHFPIELVWLTGIFTMYGGGQYIIVGVNLSMVNDISSIENRSRYLYTTFAVRYLSDTITPFVAALLLDHSLWLAALICALSLLLSYCILVVMEEPLDLIFKDRDNSLPSGFVNANWGAYNTLFSDWRVTVSLAITFLTQVRFLNLSILISYISVRFDWSIADVTRLLSIMPGVSFAVFLILPHVNRALSTRFHQTQQSYMITLALLGLLSVGDGLIIVASSIQFLLVALVIHALGYGVVAPFMALASSYVEATQATRLYTSFSVADSVAHLIGDPILQISWKQALHTGGPWLSSPFIITFGCFVLAFFLCTFLPTPLPSAIKQDSATHDENESRPLLAS